MSNARNLSKFKPSSSGLVETADIADDAVSTDQIANNATINTSGAITTTGAFTSVGIDDNADATAITIDSAENVGIGTTPESHHANWTAIDFGDQGGLAHYDGGATSLSTNLYHDGAWKAKETGTSSRLEMGADGNVNIYSGASASADASVTLTNRLTVGNDGDVTIHDGDLVIGTAGKGIDFSAQTHATSTSGAFTPSVNSEVLDHYEEGVWQFGFNTNMTVETNSNKGRYTRIGNVVTVNARMDIKTVTGSNVLFFNCLPFLVSAHTGTDTFENLYIGTLQTYNIGNGGYNVMGTQTLTENNSHTVYAMYSVHNANHAYLLNTMASTSSELYMTITYRTG